MSVLFILDFYFEVECLDIIWVFLFFFDECVCWVEVLYIFGDFFEVWIGDDGMDVFQCFIVQFLCQVVDGGMCIYLMYGNCDFFIGKVFCCEVGCMLLFDLSVIDLYGELVLLMYGDSLCI